MEEDIKYGVSNIKCPQCNIYQFNFAKMQKCKLFYGLFMHLFFIIKDSA